MRRIIQLAVLMSTALLVLPAATNAADESLDFDNKITRINYSLGYQIGGDFRRQGVEIDADAVVKGIQDALAGGQPEMSRQDMNATLMELKRKVVADERQHLRKSRREQELEYLDEGKKFLEENARKPGIKTTASGLQYKIIKPGTGKTPRPEDKVTVNYRGTLINGNEFDSSYEDGEPATFELGGVIQGWTEGLQLVREGGRIQLFVPYELAYGKRGPMAHRTLIFDVELISVGEQTQAHAGTKKDT
jgi:FKBP-type peptidyl-prolyl cis-trans isomerase FklB